MASYTTNFSWNDPIPVSPLYDYSQGMINTPQNPETLNFTKNYGINEYGYPLIASTNFNIPKAEEAKGIMQMQNRGTLDYPEVNWTMITEGPNMRGGLIPNPDYIPYEQGEHYNIEENVNPSLIDRGKEALGIGKDAIENAINYGLGAISGIPFVGPAIDFIGNQFEYRPAEIYGDEYGRIYNPEALDRMNARGGWYTEPARASRRRDKRIDWLEKRREEGKKFSEKNLARLNEQQRQEEAARVAATRAIAAQNAQTYGTDDATGGYQSSWGGNQDFMSGSGTAADMGSFADGGLASLWQR